MRKIFLVERKLLSRSFEQLYLWGRSADSAVGVTMASRSPVLLGSNSILQLLFELSFLFVREKRNRYFLKLLFSLRENSLLGRPLAPTMSPRRIRSLTLANSFSSWKNLSENEIFFRRGNSKACFLFLLQIRHDLNFDWVTVQIVEEKFRTGWTFWINSTWKRCSKVFSVEIKWKKKRTGNRNDVVARLFIRQGTVFIDEISQSEADVKFMRKNGFPDLFHLLHVLNTHFVIFLKRKNVCNETTKIFEWTEHSDRVPDHRLSLGLLPFSTLLRVL